MLKHGKLKKFVALIILDGWGIAKAGSNNLIESTPTPQFDKLVESYPSAVLVNPLEEKLLQAPSEDACRLSHFMIGTSSIENDLSALEKKNSLTINSLSRILSQHNLKQLYLTDVEKFPQAAHFYRGCYAKLLKNEEKILVKGGVITDYLNTPQMHLKEIFQELKKKLATRKFNFIMMNLSNVDVVAHTGNREATKRAIEMTDKYLGQMVEKILSWGGEVLITSDHGKAERFADGEELKKIHSTNYVPLILVSKNFEGKTFPGINLVGTDLSTLEPSGFLTDIAPTILQLLSIKKLQEMVGNSLI